MPAKKAPKGNAEHEANRRDMFDDAVVDEGMDTQELLVELARLRASHKVMIASEFRPVAALARSSYATWGRRWDSMKWLVRWKSGLQQDFSTSARRGSVKWGATGKTRLVS
jgi:hypothetical protein